MKLSSTLILLLLSLLSTQAIAGHDRWYGGHSSQASWMHNYAETSVQQARTARTRGCSFHGNGWSTDYRRHLNWAQRVNHQQARRALDRRDRELRHCRSGYGHNNYRDYGNQHGYYNQRHQPNDYRYGGHNGNRYRDNFSREEFARWYADTATAQAEQNRFSGCNIRSSKDRWTHNWGKHYRYALKGPRDKVIREVETRARQLRQCGSYQYRD